MTPPRSATLALGLLGALHAVPGVADPDLTRRVQQLERQVGELQRRLDHLDAAGSAVVAPAPAATATAPVTPLPPGPARLSGWELRYHLADQPLALAALATREPLAQGRIDAVETLRFDPAAYDIADTGVFSDYRDPSLYPEVGLQLRGLLRIDRSGEYELLVHPKPARAGAGSAASRMSLQLKIDARPVIAFDDAASWAVQRTRLQLAVGEHPIELRARVVSPGYGPSPTESLLRLQIKGPGDARPRPLQTVHPPLPAASHRDALPH